MQRSIYKKTYGKSKQQAARAAVARARATIIAARRAPPARLTSFGRAGELKSIDLTPATINIDTTGSLTLLNGVALGSDYTDRIGRKICLKSVLFRGFFEPADDSTVTNYVRMMIVYDRQANGAAPAVTDILQSASSLSSLNLNNRDRFLILADKEYVVGRVINTATQAVAYSPNVHKCKGYRKLNLDTQYKDTGATIASIASGSLYMLAIGNIAAGATAAVLNLTLRVRFSDV